MLKGQFTLPIEIDLAATLLFGLTGGLAALKRGYDVIGLSAFVGCALFAVLAVQFKMETTKAAGIAIGTSFVLRLLAIRFKLEVVRSLAGAAIPLSTT